MGSAFIMILNTINASTSQWKKYRNTIVPKILSQVSQQSSWLNGVTSSEYSDPPTCDQGLICRGASLDHFPINRELSSWDDLHNVAPLHQFHHHLVLTET